MTLPASGIIWMSQLNDEMQQPTTQYVTLADPMMTSMVGGAHDLNSYHGKSRSTGTNVYSSSNSFYVPYGCYTIWVSVYGGGGGGGASHWSNFPTANGDYYGEGFPGGQGSGVGGSIAVTPGQVVSFTVGAGGAYGQYGAAGGNSVIGPYTGSGGAGGGWGGNYGSTAPAPATYGQGGYGGYGANDYSYNGITAGNSGAIIISW